MHTFRVWAPKAKTIGVKIGKTIYPMDRTSGEWWQKDVPNVGPGTDYGFVIDGKEPSIPDPRSGWQANGVHGLSRILDHQAFGWTDTQWQPSPLASSIMYELHIGTFTPEGTFDAAQKHLAYLKDLGVTHVELMPVNAFSGERGWGYDGVDLFAPYEAYGGPEALKRFVNACHEHGLAVLLDVVYNHLGPSGNYLGKFGPYFTHLHHTPWGDAVNLEGAGSQEVRRFFCDNALMWLRDYHIDGLRLDAVHAYMDRSAIHFMEQIGKEVRALEAETGKHYVVIAESDLNDPRFVKAVEAGGYGMDAQWSDDFHHALFALLTGERNGYYSDFGSIADLAKALKSVFVYDGIYVPHRDRIHGRPVESLPAWRFLGYSQNHDQVGNRAKGDRLCHIVDEGRAKIAAALVFTSPFVPLLFQGEEWAASSPFQYFTDHGPELGKLVSKGRKKEFAAFGWNPKDIPDPQDEQTFLRSKLKWEEQSQPPHAEMLDWYRKLIALRKLHPDLTNGSLEEIEIEISEKERWLLLRRGAIEVTVNLSNRPLTRCVARQAAMLLASSNSATLDQTSLTLPPDSVAILRIE